MFLAHRALNKRFNVCSISLSTYVKDGEIIHVGKLMQDLYINYRNMPIENNDNFFDYVNNVDPSYPNIISLYTACSIIPYEVQS